MEKEDKFERWARETIQSLPAIFREKMRNIHITVEEEPGPHITKKFSLPRPPLFLGLYQGVPLTKRSVHHSPVFPDKITIFRGPIERRCSSEKKQREMVVKTVLHEVGHYFGLSEKELREIKKNK